MPYTLLWLPIFLAGLDWVAVAYKIKRLEYLAKPAVMLALLAWLVLAGDLSSRLLWFAFGLVFSLAGDVFLMLPRERFIQGLVAFLLAHIAYIAGFNPNFPPINAASILILFFIGMAAVGLYRRIASGLRTRQQEKWLLPVMVYSIVISLMLFSALMTLVRSDWMVLPSLLVGSGALLFFLSDTFLAWRKFVSPLPYGHMLVIVTYHLGQVAIITGATLHYTTAG